MSEAEVARRLRITNRLEELRAKHGRDIEQLPMPPWLDTLEGFQAAHSAQSLHPEEEKAPPVAAPPDAQNRVVERSGGQLPPTRIDEP